MPDIKEKGGGGNRAKKTSSKSRRTKEGEGQAKAAGYERAAAIGEDLGYGYGERGGRLSGEGGV